MTRGQAGRAAGICLYLGRAGVINMRASSLTGSRIRPNKLEARARSPLIVAGAREPIRGADAKC